MNKSENYILVGLGNPGAEYFSTRHNAGKMLAAWLKAKGQGLRAKGESGLEEFEIVETDCFMNHSGEWIRKKLKSYGLWVVGYGSSREGEGESASSTSSFPDSQLTTHNSQLIVAHDDLDLPLGGFKIQFATGPRLHKGILSIEQSLGTKDFWRVRIGVENRLSVAATKPVSANDSDSRGRLTIPASQTPPLAGTIRCPSGEDYVLRPFKREEKLILNRTFGLIKQTLAEQFTKSFRSDVDSKLIN